MIVATQLGLPFIEYLTRDEIKDLVVDCIKAAFVYETKTYDPDGPPYELQTNVYQRSIRNVTKQLREFGFERDDKGSQARLICKTDRFPIPVRLLFCKGEINDSKSIKGNEKGAYSAGLIRQNATRIPQITFCDIDEDFKASLPEIVTGTDFEEDALNYWFYWHFHNDYFTIMASFPDGLQGHTIVCHSQAANLKMLYAGMPLAEESTPKLEELPQAVRVTPTIRARPAAAASDAG